MRKINNMIRTQFPNFIREGNHEKFVAFLQAYYDFLEKEGKPNNILAIYNELNDVDKTLEPFLRNFVESFAFAIPSRFFASKRDALKHFKEINSIKGTPRSYELLFRFLYNELIEFYFPEIDILRTSAATWERKHIVAIQSDVFPDVFFETLRSVNSRFHVNDVRLVSRRYDAYYIEFAAESFEGFFDPEMDNLFWVPGFSIIERNTERVVSRHDHLHEAENALAQMPSNVRDQHFIQDNEIVTKAWNMRPFNAISGVRIITPGAGYEKDTEFVYTDGIHRASLVIDNVGVNGDIINLRIRSQSYMPSPRPTSMMPSPTIMPTDTVIPTPLAAIDITYQGWLMSVEYLYFGTQAEIEFIYNPFFVYNQPAQESFNQPSGRSRLQDGVFYSPYTYVIKSGQSIDLWKDMVYKMLHPAGMAVFSQILIMSGAKAISADQGPAQIIMYIFNWEVQGGILYALQVIAETKTEIRLVYVPSIYTRNISSYENWKFIVPPYEGGHTFQGIHRDDSESYYSVDLGVPPPPLGEFNTDAIYYESGKFLHNHFNVGTIGNLTFEQFLEPEKHPASLRPGSFIEITTVTREGTGLLTDNTGNIAGVGEMPIVLMNEGNGLISENGNLTGTGLTDSNGTGLITENGVIAGVGEHPAVSATPLLSSHYWALDETGNQLSDSVGDLGTVTVKGDATGVSSVVAPSPFGRARDFGDAEYMFALWDGTKNTTETIPVWSLSFRVFRNGAAPDWSDIFYQGDANVSNDFIALYVDEDGSTLYVDTRKNQGAWVSIGPILATPLWNGDWHRITLVSDGTTISVYVDTTLVGTLATTVVLTPKNDMTFGGAFQASMSQYNAYGYNVIDDIAIFNEPIDPSTINGFLTLPAAQWTV